MRTKYHTEVRPVRITDPRYNLASQGTIDFPGSIFFRIFESLALQREEVIRVITNPQLRGQTILATTYCFRMLNRFTDDL